MRFMLDQLNPAMRKQVEEKLRIPSKVVKPEAKYRAKPTEVDGQRFASKREAKRFQTLEAMQFAGNISDLRTQTSFDLTVNGQLICRYIADFTYRQRGALVVEDSKGMRKGVPYQLFKLKAALMRAIHGINVREV